MIPPIPRFNRRVNASKGPVLSRPALETSSPASRHLWFAENDALCLVWQHGTISRTVRRVPWHDVFAFSEALAKRQHAAQRFGTGVHTCNLLVAHRSGGRVQVQPLELCSDRREDLQRARRFFEHTHPMP